MYAGVAFFESGRGVTSGRMQCLDGYGAASAKMDEV